MLLEIVSKNNNCSSQVTLELLLWINKYMWRREKEREGGDFFKTLFVTAPNSFY